MNSLPFLLERASTQATLFEALFWVITAVTAGASLLVFAYLAYACAAYKRTPGKIDTPRILGSHKLELMWTLAPLLIFLILYGFGVYVYDHAMVHSAPKDAIHVHVIGKQWMWKAQYGGESGARVIIGGNPANMSEADRESIGALVLPVNRAVRLTFISEDVIHDFGVPAFRSKIDVVPGRYVETWYEPTKIGEYHVFCDQYCGTWHSLMVGKIRVVSQADFDDFLLGLNNAQAKKTGGPADNTPAWKGQQVYRMLQCSNCHTNNSLARAPVLEGLAGSDIQYTIKGLDGIHDAKADENYLRESVVNPQAKIRLGWGRAPDGGSIMPNYRVGPTTDKEKATITPEDLNNLVMYLRSLKKGGTIQRNEKGAEPVSAPGNPPASAPTTSSPTPKS